MSDDGHIDHAKLQQRYLVHYECDMGPRFSVDVWSNERQAREDRDGYREDGLAARILKVTVVDGNPVAEWVGE